MPCRHSMGFICNLDSQAYADAIGTIPTIPVINGMMDSATTLYDGSEDGAQQGTS